MRDTTEAEQAVLDAFERGKMVGYAEGIRDSKAEIEALKDMLEEEGIGVSQKYLDERISERQEK